MDSTATKQMLTRKEPAELYDAVKPVLHDAELRDWLVNGSFEKNETVRYNCVRVLFRAMEREPQLFYPYWDRFAAMVVSPNGFHRSAAAQAIAHLAGVDAECKLDGLLRIYLRLMDDPKVMVRHYFIETLDRIYLARPEFQSKVIATLLSLDQTHHLPQRRDLLKADVLAVFDRLYEALPDKDKKRALRFACQSLQCDSGKTRKAAQEFLEKHGN